MIGCSYTGLLITVTATTTISVQVFKGQYQLRRGLQYLPDPVVILDATTRTPFSSETDGRIDRRGIKVDGMREFWKQAFALRVEIAPPNRRSEPGRMPP